MRTRRQLAFLLLIVVGCSSELQAQHTGAVASTRASTHAPAAGDLSQWTQSERRLQAAGSGKGKRRQQRLRRSGDGDKAGGGGAGGKALGKGGQQCTKASAEEVAALREPPPTGGVETQRWLTLSLPATAAPDGLDDLHGPASKNRLKAVAAASLKLQLEQLRRGLGVALALNRTLVLPELQCYCASACAASCEAPAKKGKKLLQPCNVSEVLHPKLLKSGGVVLGGRSVTLRTQQVLKHAAVKRLVSKPGATVQVVVGKPTCNADAGTERTLLAASAAAAAGGPEGDAPMQLRKLLAGGRGKKQRGGAGGAAGRERPSKRQKVWGQPGTGAGRPRASVCLEEVKGKKGALELLVPGALTGEEVTHLLVKYSSVPVLHIADVLSLFLEFADERVQDALERIPLRLPVTCCEAR